MNRLPDIHDELDAALKALHSTVEHIMRLEDRVKCLDTQVQRMEAGLNILDEFKASSGCCCRDGN